MECPIDIVNWNRILHFLGSEHVSGVSLTSKFLYIFCSCYNLNISHDKHDGQRAREIILPSILIPPVLFSQLITKGSVLSSLRTILISLKKGLRPTEEHLIAVPNIAKSLRFHPIDQFVLQAKHFHHQSMLNELSNSISQKMFRGLESLCYIKYINSSKGFGLFASKTIQKGTSISIYYGEVISKQEARNRYVHYDEQGLNYVMVIKEYTQDHNFAMTSIFDATRFGNEARFTNHSCEPNCEIVMQRSSKDQIFAAPVIIALGTIVAGDEITISYSSSELSACSEGATTRNNIDFPSRICYCGTPSCVGILPQLTV